MNYSDAIEAKYATLRAMRSWIESPDCVNNITRDDGEQVAARRLVTRSILPTCDTYYYAPDIASAVLASATSVPEDTSVSIRQMPESGWMWFPQPFKAGELSRSLPVSGIAWFRVALIDKNSELTLPGFCLMSFSSAQDGGFGPLSTLDIGCVMFHEGATIGQLCRTAPYGTNLIKFWTASQLWMEQRISVASSERIERACRRRLEREGAHVPALSVVHLRRQDRGGAPSHRLGLEWSCQWIVRGHWRQQFYPSTGLRSPLWIMPYVKGPEDAPLKMPTETVFAVTR